MKPLSVFVEKYGVCISVPVGELLSQGVVIRPPIKHDLIAYMPFCPLPSRSVLGSKGIDRILEVPLSTEEEQGFLKSVDTLKQVAASLK